jgi:hypothetical protein
LKFRERREIFSPSEQLLAFQFIRIWAGSGYCPAAGDYKQDKENWLSTKGD